MAAANAADRFLSREQPLLDWEEGSAHSTAKADAINVPVTVLVNQQTAGAAEALAAALRETDAAVLIGARSAGKVLALERVDFFDWATLKTSTRALLVGISDGICCTGGGAGHSVT